MRRFIYPVLGALIFLAIVGAVSLLGTEGLSQSYGGKIYCEYADTDRYSYEDEYPPFSCSVRLEQVAAAPAGPNDTHQPQHHSDAYTVLAGIGRWFARLFEDPIAGFTAVLTISTALLWFETRRLAKGADAQITKMGEHVTEAKAAADAMGKVATAMNNTAIATKDAAEAAQGSLDLANQEFIANHPPRLIVHNIMADDFGAVFRNRDGGGPPVSGMPTTMQPGDAIKGILFVRNVGGSAATVTSSYGTVYIRRESVLPIRPPYHGRMGNEFLDNVRIATGVSKEASFIDDNGETMDHWAGSDYGIYILGWIEYRDDNRIDRRMAFCRRYDRGERRFVPVNNPDYEWEG